MVITFHQIPLKGTHPSFPHVMNSLQVMYTKEVVRSRQSSPVENLPCTLCFTLTKQEDSIPEEHPNTLPLVAPSCSDPLSPDPQRRESQHTLCRVPYLTARATTKMTHMQYAPGHSNLNAISLVATKPAKAGSASFLLLWRPLTSHSFVRSLSQSAPVRYTTPSTPAHTHIIRMHCLLLPLPTVLSLLC